MRRRIFHSKNRGIGSLTVLDEDLLQSERYIDTEMGVLLPPTSVVGQE